MSLTLFLTSYIRAHRFQAGSGPAASYLFCFAKKGNPKKATTLPLAFGFPIVQVKKWESLEMGLRNVRLQANTVPQAKRMRLEFPATPQTQGFLYPFSALHNWQCQKWMKVKSKIIDRR